MKKTVGLGVAFCAAVLAYLIFSSFQTKPYRCNVCITFKGARNCKTASADSEMDAIRTATTNVCGEIAGGVTETIQCENTKPDSITWSRRPGN
jgi:hypothetical protein